MLPILLAASLAGCAVQPASPPAQPVPLPQQGGIGDPGRQAVLSSAAVFADTRRIAGRPAEAARAVSRLEWMAATLPTDPAWIPASPLVFQSLRQGQAATRRVLGLDQAASPAAVSRALLDAAAALDAANREAATTALAPVAPGGGAALLARLESLPQVPEAANATRAAQSEMLRMMQEDPSS